MGAIFALKGYRTQFLYSLHKILSEYNKGYIFQPEGKFEDLDILDINNSYIEIIQIKNKLNPLIYSDLVSKKTSFFQRASNVLNHSPNVIVKLVSFNGISDEVTNKEKLQKKLTKSGLKKDDIDKIIQNFTFEIVNESELESKIIEILKKISLFSDSKIALELLIYWLFITGEKQQSIFSKGLISKLESIGKFLNEQLSFNNSYGNTIIPFTTKSILNDNLEIYKEGFYYGVSAKFEHILANLDVHRKDKLESINEAFKTDNIVFVHGASGQGKSTLAYRYINDFTPNSTSYELKVSQDINEVYQTINSLDALSRGLDFPILLYIDIKPQDIYWNEILKELYGRKNLRFLITIRQEDWNKTTLGFEFKFNDIDLSFDKSEAKVIYDSLSKFKEDLKFIDFEESWNKFNNGGLLLEYVYLINQGDSLESRLKDQIRRIQEKVSVNKTEELEILRYVCLADIFNSKISYKKLVGKLNINTPKLYIDYFQKEYLLQYSQDKEYITGLHPIRSKIICEILFSEENYIDIYDYVTNSINLINEEDLQIYLLESFHKGYDVFTCIETLKNIKFNTWTAYSGIFNTLIWKGIYDFIFIKNIKPISKLHSEFKSSWSSLVPFDFTNNERENGIFGILESYYPEEKKGYIKGIHKDFTHKLVIYEYVTIFLSEIEFIKSNILNLNDIKSLGEVNFWISELKLSITTIIDEEDLSRILDTSLSLKDFSILLFGLQLNNYNSLYVIEIKNKFIDRIRKEYNILFFSETKKIECKYFYDPIEYDEKVIKEGDYLNSTSMEIIDLLRFAFPNKEVYSTKGIGFNFFGIEMPYDPTLKEIPISNIPTPFLVTNNALISNLYNYQFKPENWNEYVDCVVQKREKYIVRLFQLIQKFEEYFKNKNIVKFIEELGKLKLKVQEINSIPFPKNISDKWGYVSDESNLNRLDDNSNNIVTENITSLEKYSKLKGYSNSFFNSINGFFNTVENNVINVQKSRLFVENDDKYNLNPAFMNIKSALKNCNLYHREFIDLFSKFCDENKLDQIHIKENKNLEILFNCWHQFNFKKGNLNKKIINQTNQNFIAVKNDIKKRLLKERKIIHRDYGLLFDVYLDTKAGNILILTSEICSEDFAYSVAVARVFLQKTINVSNTSVKSVYIESNIAEAIFIPYFNGKPINKGAIELAIHNLDKEIDDCGFWFNPTYEINEETINFLNLEFWNTKLPKIADYERVLVDIVSYKEIKNQIINIKNSESVFDNLGSNILKQYEEKVTNFLNNRILESKDLWIEIKDEFDNDLVHFDVLEVLNKILKKEQIEGLEFENILNVLDTNYRIFAEKLIDKIM
ncbi:hypothetical protein [Flavobacterium magnesitis]